MSKLLLPVKYACCILLLSLSPLLKAQDGYYNDAQVWGRLKLEKTLGKKFSVYVTEGIRATKDVSDLGRVATYAGVNFKLNKHIKFSVGGAYVNKKKDHPYYDTRYKYYGDVTFDTKAGRWKFAYRNRFQCYYKNKELTGYIPYCWDRNKLTVEFEATKRVSFYVAEEVYIPLNDPQATGLSKSRSYAGTLIKTFKHQELELYFLCQAQLQNSDWFKQRNKYQNLPLYRYFVYGVTYAIEF